MNHPNPHPALGPRGPRAGTAIAAGVLGALTGLWHALGLFLGIATVTGVSNAEEMVVGIGLNAIVAGFSSAGAIGLFARKRAGRVMVVLGGVLAIGLYVFLASHSGTASGGVTGAVALAIVGVPALTAVVLALLPATARWLAWGEPAVPPPSYRPGTASRRMRG